MFRYTLVVTAILAALPLQAAVTDFQVISRTNIANGAEKITARATIALSPLDVRNQVIVDLDKAPRNSRGAVEAVADVVIVRPAKASGTLLVELPNRGASPLWGMLNDLDMPTGQRLEQAGNGFVLSRGYTLAIIGWQGDVDRSKGIGIQLPIATGVTGWSRDQWQFPDDERVKRVKVSWPIADAKSLRIGIRPRADADLLRPSGLSVRMVDEQTVEITRPAAAAGNGIYELGYTAKDSAVMGMGFAAVRDVTSFLIHDASAKNPLVSAGKSGVTRAIATGVSQTGRALRDLLYWGFNEDESEHGRAVFVGMLPIVPGTRRTFTNARFAQPNRNPGPEADQLYPVDQFPFTYEESEDSLSGRKDGLLRRCRLSHTCPRIVEFDSEYEMWGSRGGLLVADSRGKPLPLPPQVRAYMLTGAPHYNPWNAVSSNDPRCRMASSPIAAGPAIRALLVVLQDWADRDVNPPPSRYPSISDGTLVPPNEVYAKGLPVPYRAQYLRAQLIEQTASGPRIKGEYPVLLPKADADGIAIAGIRLPAVAAPRATFVGWNPQVNASGPQDLCDHAAGMIPFARTRAERMAAHDPRVSLEERYATGEAYMQAVRNAADKLVTERLLLRADADAAVAAAQTLADSQPAQ